MDQAPLFDLDNALMEMGLLGELAKSLHQMVSLNFTDLFFAS
jgi:hypothetical protein